MIMNDLIIFMNSIWIPVLLAILCAGYGIYLAITKDPKVIRRKTGRNDLLKAPDKYVRNAMWLMFFMAVGCVVMVMIIYFTANDMIATVESISWFIVFAFLWKKNEDTNGAL